MDAIDAEIASGQVNVRGALDLLLGEIPRDRLVVAVARTGGPAQFCAGQPFTIDDLFFWPSGRRSSLIDLAIQQSETPA